jgi:dienelactone hydrolase
MGAAVSGAHHGAMTPETLGTLQEAARHNRGLVVARVRAALARGTRRREALESPAQVRSWQEEQRAFLRRASAPMPPLDRAAPEVREGADLERKGYTITPLLIASRPGIWISAHLYLPAGLASPVPGVLIACGHSEEGKGYAPYQQAGALCATSGLAALVFDPLDQGERGQDLDESGRRRTWGTRAHNLSGAKALLVGWSQTGLEAWDAARALDALAARPEVDASRLGVMGNSGGGTQAAQLFALDERLGAAAPSCYLTSHGHLAGGIGPQDAEQWQPGALRAGLDHADYLALRAPAPALICGVERDFFPIAGTREALAAARRVYRLMGAEEAVDLVTVEETHGWHPPLQVASVRWMARHLAGREVEPRWTAEVPMTPDEAGVALGGVLALEGARSVHELLREEAEHLASARSGLSRTQLLEAARALAGVRPEGERPAARFEPSQPTGADGGQPGWIVLEDGMRLPAARRARPGRPAVVHLGRGAHTRGFEGLPEDEDQLLVDPLAFADAAPDEGSWYGAFGSSARDAAWLYQLGETLVGVHAEQLLAAAALLPGRPAVVAHGLAQVGACHALALEPERLDAAGSRVRPGTWRALFETNAIEGWFAFVVPGALASYDLDELVQ